MKHLHLGINILALGAIALGFTGPAAADEIKERKIAVFEEPVPLSVGISQSISASFRANREKPELGRAWIEISLYTPSGLPADSAGETTIIKKNVPGLTYLPSSQEVVLARDGHAPVVCAKWVEKRFLFFHSQSLESTGNCELSAGFELRTVDNGFELSEVPFGVVQLNPSQERLPASEKP